MKKRKVIPVAIALVAVIAVSGVAYAWWSSAGGGTGQAGVGTSTGLTVSQTLPAPSNLVPGGAAQNVTVNVLNPATFSQSLSTITITVDAAQLPTGCLVGWFTVVSPTVSPSPYVLTGGSSHDFVGSIQLIESGTPQDACKSATIHLIFAVS